MSGPSPEQTHEPAVDVTARRIAMLYIRFRGRFGTAEATFRGMLDAGVIQAGPAVTGDIEEAE